MGRVKRTKLQRLTSPVHRDWIAEKKSTRTMEGLILHAEISSSLRVHFSSHVIAPFPPQEKPDGRASGITLPIICLLGSLASRARHRGVTKNSLDPLATLSHSPHLWRCSLLIGSTKRLPLQPASPLASFVASGTHERARTRDRHSRFWEDAGVAANNRHDGPFFFLPLGIKGTGGRTLTIDCGCGCQSRVDHATDLLWTSWVCFGRVGTYCVDDDDDDKEEMYWCVLVIQHQQTHTHTLRLRPTSMWTTRREYVYLT